MLSDILREKVDKWIAKSREEDREKARARGHAEGRAEGRAVGQAEGLAEVQRMQKLWQEWNRRRLAHEARSEPFDEPPPSLNVDNGHREDGSAV